MSIEGKTALVTGAAGNLGRAVAAAFHARGASVVELDQAPVPASAGAAGAAGAPDARRLILQADLLDPQSLEAAVQRAAPRFGGIDILCNVAGGFTMGDPVHATPLDTWRHMIDLNATSILNTARAVVPQMLERKGGKIITIAAAAGAAGRPHMGAYSASKSMAIRLTESMAMELREQGINVNCIAPTIIDTPPNRAAMPDADPSRWVSPEAIAEIVLFLASDAARAIHGATIPANGLS